MAAAAAREQLATSSASISTTAAAAAAANGVVKSTSGSNDNVRLLVYIFWTCVCLLESDYEHEFVLAAEIVELILGKVKTQPPQVSTTLAAAAATSSSSSSSSALVVTHKNELRTALELFALRIDWPPHFVGLHALVLKGCTSTSPHTLATTQRLLVHLISYCCSLNLLDPAPAAATTTSSSSNGNGMHTLALNMLAMLPTMLLNYERPSELCRQAAQAYCQALNTLAPSTAPRMAPTAVPASRRSVKFSIVQMAKKHPSKKLMKKN